MRVLPATGSQIYGKIFDKSSIENFSGNKGKITLGTNFCGRGTNIHYDDDYPLHVIITYGPRNVRALGQAIGRTGRNGKHGTTRIICHIDQFLYPVIFQDNGISEVISEFKIKDKLQNEYIKIFKILKPWIFSNIEEKQIFSKENKKTMKDILINYSMNYFYKLRVNFA